MALMPPLQGRISQNGRICGRPEPSPRHVISMSSCCTTIQYRPVHNLGTTRPATVEDSQSRLLSKTEATPTISEMTIGFYVEN